MYVCVESVPLRSVTKSIRSGAASVRLAPVIPKNTRQETDLLLHIGMHSETGFDRSGKRFGFGKRENLYRQRSFADENKRTRHRTDGMGVGVKSFIDVPSPSRIRTIPTGLLEIARYPYRQRPMRNRQIYYTRLGLVLLYIFYVRFNRARRRFTFFNKRLGRERQPYGSSSLPRGVFNKKKKLVFVLNARAVSGRRIFIVVDRFSIVRLT